MSITMKMMKITAIEISTKMKTMVKAITVSSLCHTPPPPPPPPKKKKKKVILILGFG